MEILPWLIAIIIIILGSIIFFSILNSFGKFKNYNKPITRALEKCDYARAEKIALRYIDTYPHDFLLKYYLGQAYEGQRNYAKAIFYYEKAAILVASETDHQLRSQFYLQIAELYRRRQQYKEGVGYYALVLEKDPNNTRAHLSIGECFFQLGMYTKAKEHLIQYTSLKPGNVKAYYLLAETCEKTRHLEDALSNYEEIIQNYPNIDEVLTTRSISRAAEVSIKLQNHQKAESYLRKLLSLDDYYEEALVKLVSIFTLTSRVDEAVGLAEEFEKKVSAITRAELLFHIGNGYFKKGLYYKAMTIWKKGFQLNTAHTQLREIVSHYADILEHKGMDIYYGNSKQSFEQFITQGFPYKHIKSTYEQNHFWILQVQETLVVLDRSPFPFKERDIATVEDSIKTRFNVAPFFTLYSLFGIEGWDDVRIKEQNQIEVIQKNDFIKWITETFARFKEKNTPTP